MFPERFKASVSRHLEEVRRLHSRDLSAGLGRAPLPDALDRKYPNAATSWQWQFVFPAARICRDPRWGPPCRFHLHESAVQRAVAEASSRRDPQEGLVSLLSTFVRDAPSGGRLRHPHGPGAARSHRRQHHDDLHTRAQSWGIRCAKPPLTGCKEWLLAGVAGNGDRRTAVALNELLLAPFPSSVPRADIGVTCEGRSQASRQPTQVWLAAILGAGRVLASRRQLFAVFQGAE